MILGRRSCHITYPTLSITLCVSWWKEVWSHVCRSCGCDIIIPTCTTLVQASWNEDGQTYLRTASCLSQSCDEIQSPPPWSAGQPQGESTKQQCDEVRTPCSHALSHNPNQMFCSTVQYQLPTTLLVQPPCCLAASSHYRVNAPPPAARDATGRYARVFQLNVIPLVELLTSHHCHHPVLITPICFFFLFGFESTQSAPQLHQDSGTHTDGGAAIRKPRSACHEGTPAMDLGHMNVFLKWMYLYVGSVLRIWNLSEVIYFYVDIDCRDCNYL